MWKDDPHWMPYLLNDQCFGGTLEFEGHEILKEINIKVMNRADLISY